MVRTAEKEEIRKEPDAKLNARPGSGERLVTGIVILNYKTPDDVLTCVKSVRENTAGPYRIFVVDNDSPDGSFETLSESLAGQSDVTVIESGRNGGFSYGNNVGFRRAVAEGCDPVLSTNADVVFRAGAIDRLAARLLEEPDCAVAGPLVLFADGEVQRYTRGILTARVLLARRKGLSFFAPKKAVRAYEYADADYRRKFYPSGMVSGCCFMIRAHVLEKIGYLDEYPFLYNEEDILGAKLRALGMKTVYDPSAEVVHWGGKSTGGVSPFVRYHTFRSGLYYIRRYSDAGNAAFSRTARILSILFTLTAIRHKEYRPYRKLLRKDIRDMKQMKKASL